METAVEESQQLEMDMCGSNYAIQVPSLMIAYTLYLRMQLPEAF